MIYIDSYTLEIFDCQQYDLLRYFVMYDRNYNTSFGATSPSQKIPERVFSVHTVGVYNQSQQPRLRLEATRSSKKQLDNASMSALNDFHH